jgi:hypothetical protein
VKVAYKERIDVYCDACGEIALGGCHQPASIFYHNNTDECWGGSGWDELEPENALRVAHPDEFFDVLVCGYIAQEEVYICHECQNENFNNYVVEFVRKVRAHRGQLLTKLIAEAKIPDLIPEDDQKEKRRAEYDTQLEDLYKEMVDSFGHVENHRPLSAGDARVFIDRALKIHDKRKALLA